MKNASNQEIACVRTICKSCKQNFNFNKKLFEHINEHEVLKRINTIKTTCDFEKKSIDICSFFSHESLNFTTSENLTSDTKTSLRFVSSKYSNFQLRVFNLTSKSTKNASISRIVCVRTICKRCNQIFNFNNKFHEHIRERHARKSVKSLNLRVFTSEFTYKIVEKSTSICSSASLISQKSSVFFTTSRNQKFWFSIIFESVIASTSSNFSIATYKFNSKSIESAIVNCSFISSFISSHVSIRNFHESHIQTHFIVNDLRRMFHEKSKSFDLRQHHNRRFFSQSFDLRQFDRSCSTFSKKSYFIIKNLFEMFDEKFRKKSLFQNQKSVSSREFFSSQSRITIYFKFTINQKSSINQDSKSSKSKSLNQHMFAKSIRIVCQQKFAREIDQIITQNVRCLLHHLEVFCRDFFFHFHTSSFSLHFFFVLAFVAIISTVRTSCISVYQQIILIIDRINIEFVASKRSWEKTKNRLLEYLVTKHQKFEFSTFYIQNHISNLEKASFRSSVYFIIYVIVCIFCELIVNQSLYQLQWFRSSISRINLHSLSKYKYLYLHRKSDKSESLFWSETQSVEQSSRLDQFVSRFFDFKYFQMIYHITYSQISWLMFRSQISNWNSKTFSSFLLCICINH